MLLKKCGNSSMWTGMMSPMKGIGLLRNLESIAFSLESIYKDLNPACFWKLFELLYLAICNSELNMNEKKMSLIEMEGQK